MNILVIYDKSKANINNVCKAFSILGHNVMILNFINKNLYNLYTNIMKKKFDAVFTIINYKDKESKLLIKILRILHIQIIDEDYCYHNLSNILNIKN